MPYYSPLTMAKDECANFNDSNSSCLGVTADSLRQEPKNVRAHPRSRCLLADGGRCDYFERIVLPLAERGVTHFLDARDAYFAKAIRAAGMRPNAELTLAQPKTIRQCQCGNPLAAGHRFCEKCKTAKRRETYRSSKTRQRDQGAPRPEN